MKKIISILIVALVILSTFIFTGCNEAIEGTIDYKDADKYTIGNAIIKEEVKEVNIDWISGSIKVEQTSNEILEVKEECSEDLKDDYRVRWYLDGTTLYIKFSAPKIILDIHSKKELSVRLPASVNLDKVNINTTSATTNIADLKASEVSLVSVSGDISVQSITEKMDVTTTSGALTIYTKNTKDLSIGTTSGEVMLYGDVSDTMKVNSVSGQLNADLDVTPNQLDVETVSGEVTLLLPKDPSFKATITTVSGDTHMSMPIVQDKNVYTSKDGKAQFEINTVSGDIDISER